MVAVTPALAVLVVLLLACLCRLGVQWKIRVREDRARVRTCGRCGIQQRRRFNDLVPGSPHWWEPLVIVLACLVAAPCYAGEIAYDLSPPLTSDVDSCGAKDAPLTDFDHYLVHLYRCRPDSLVHRQPPLKPLWIARRDSLAFNLPGDTDSVRFTVADGIHGWTQVWAVDQSGNRSCAYLSDTWATKAVATPPDTTSGIAPRFFVGTSRGGQAITGPRAAIDYYWALSAPIAGIPADQWSAEFTGRLIVPTSGAYTIYLKSEDGGQVFLDGTLLINRYGVQPLTEWSANVTLMAGEHNLQVTYMANNGNSEIHLSWQGPGIAKGTIPRSSLK